MQAGAHSIRDLRPDKDKITISFKRFQVLRSIAYAAKTCDLTRMNELIIELEALEISELVGLMKTQNV